MALQVWLPLNKNGDLKNQGLADVTVTNNGATYNASGKIGGCYSFSNNYLLIQNTPLSSSTAEFSISAWVYITSLANSYGPIYNSRTATSGAGIVFWLTGSGFRLDDGSMWEVSYGHTLNSWEHVCWTRGSGKNKIYVNGSLIYTSSSVGNLSGVAATAYIAKDLQSPSTYYINGKLNDIRIYDHCLSAQEVKEISKGLVIHYPLDDGNVTNIAYDCSGYCNNGTITGTLTTNADTPRHDKCTLFGNSIKITPPIFPSFLTNEATVSMWVKLDQLPPSSPGRTMLYTAWYGFSCEITSSGQTYFRTYLTSGSVDSPLGTMTTGNWIHWVGVKSSTGVLLYLNGALIGTTTNSNNFNWYSNVNNSIACYSGSYYLYGKLSDLRLYATALSADDVKELYNTAAFVDNHGNVECFQAYEDSDSQVMKTGLVKTGEFKEVSKNLFNKDEVAFNSCNYGSVPNAFTMISYTGKCTPAKSIPIKPNTWYVLSYNETTVSVNSQAFNTTWWDITGKVKVAEDTSGGSLGFYNKVKLKSPANAYFVSFSNFGSLSDANQLILVNSLQLEEGEAFTSYESHFIDVASVYNNKIECNQLIEI